MGDVMHLMPRRKRIALIAHDNCKADMLEWARFNVDTLGAHELHATGTTGALLANELGLLRLHNLRLRGRVPRHVFRRSEADGAVLMRRRLSPATAGM